MGRHRDDAVARRRSRRRLVVGLVAGALAVVLAAVGGAAWAAGVFKGTLPSLADLSGCARQTTIRVVADPAIAPTLARAATSFDVVTPCVTTTVTARRSVDTAAVLAAGGNVGADVWVPDSPGWQRRVDAAARSLDRQPPPAVFGADVAASPLVFAVPARVATAFAAGHPSWSSVASGSTRALLPDPETDGASLLALSELAAAEPGGDPGALAATMIALGKDSPETAEAAFAAAGSATPPTAVITTEQSVVAHDAAHPRDRFVAVVPGGGTEADAFPFVRLAGRSTGDPVRDRLVAALERALTTDARHLAEGGFRRGDGGGTLHAPGVPVEETAPVSGVPPAQTGLLQEWETVAVRGPAPSV